MADSTQAFQWTGINNEGKRTKGTVKAADMKDAQSELKKMGIEVISLQQRNQASGGLHFSPRQKKIKPADILNFTRYISMMLASGLPILQALEIIAHDQENPSMRSLVNTIKTNVAGGKTLAESFNQYPQHFGDLYINLIKTGEKSGTLDKILLRLGDHLERTEGMKRKIKKALVYPTAIISVAMIVSLVLLLFVVPQFQAMFNSFGAQLPMFTRIVVNMSHFLRNYWWAIFLVIGSGYAGLRYYARGNQRVIEFFDRLLLRVHIIGPILQKGLIARFTRTLATTLEAGMPISESMKTMPQIMSNSVYSKAVVKIREDVISGHQLSVSMKETNLFPNMAVQMIAIGEASGALAAMLNKVADHYEEEVNYTVDNLSSLLEPVIMLVLGVIVGGFVIAMYLPIFKMGSLF
jgi:type IV pilus assembly protein PilC